MKKETSAATTLLQKEATARAERNDPNSVSEDSFRSQLAEANRSNNQDRFHSVLNEYERRYGASKAANGLMQVIDNNTNQTQGLMGGRNRAEFLRSIAEQHGSLSKTPDFLKYLQAGGQHNVTGRGIVNTAFAQANADGTGNFITEDIPVGDINADQISASNADTMVRLIDNGKFTQTTARQMMGNKTIMSKMDETQRLIVANLAVNGTRLYKREAEALLAGRNQWNDRDNLTGSGAGATVSTSISPTVVQSLLRPTPDDVNIASAEPDAVVSTNIVQNNDTQANPVLVQVQENLPASPTPPTPTAPSTPQPAPVPDDQQNTLVIPHYQNPRASDVKVSRPARLQRNTYRRPDHPSNNAGNTSK